MSSKEVHKCSSICPSLEFLQNEKILTNVVCTVPNCDEIFLNQSNLNFHLEKVHKLKIEKQTNELVLTRARSKSQKLAENCSCKYYCPIEGCKFFIGSVKHLPTFHSLKNHFIRIHGEKTLSCSKCQRQFSIKSEMERHEESCGVVFKCSCGCPYASRLSLLKHARKKNHPLDDEKGEDVSKSRSHDHQTREITKKTSETPTKRPHVKIQPAPVKTNSQQQFPSQVFLIPISLNATNNDPNLQRSLGCQTRFEQMGNETQEIACQTIYNNLIEVTKTNNISTGQQCTSTDNDPFSFEASTSTSIDRLNNSFQSQNTQTLNQIELENDAYMKMIIADISTQTQAPSYSTGFSQTQTYFENPIHQNREIQTSEILQNTMCTQTCLSSYLNNDGAGESISRQETDDLNLELSVLDQEVYYAASELNVAQTSGPVSSSWTQAGTQYPVQSNSIDFMSQTNLDFGGVASSCQTDEFYFGHNFSGNTNSIQTQTRGGFYTGIENVDTITQTDHINMFCLDKSM